MNDEWIELLAGNLTPDEESAVVASTASDLDGFLDAHPEAREDVSMIIKVHLDPASSSEDRAWDMFVDALGSYADVDYAYLLSWLAYADRGRRMEVLEGNASPQVVDFARAMLGLHGLLLQRAMVLSVENPDDWQSTVTYVFQEQATQAYHLRADITKYSGDRIKLEGPPDSMMALAGTLLTMLSTVGNRAAFTEGTIDEFLPRADEFLGFLRAEASDGSAAPIALAPVVAEAQSEVNTVDPV